MKKYLAGSAIKLQWISSGTLTSSLDYAIYTGSETCVGSGSFTSSGNGFYYAWYTTPSSAAGYYSARIDATIGGNPFPRAVQFRTVLDQVD